MGASRGGDRLARRRRREAAEPELPPAVRRRLAAGGFVSRAPPFFPGFVQDTAVPNAGLSARISRAGELTPVPALTPAGFLTNLAAIGRAVLRDVLLLSQSGVGLGRSLGAPEFVTITVLVALLSIIVPFGPATESPALDARVARRSPGLSPLPTNRRGVKAKFAPPVSGNHAPIML